MALFKVDQACSGYPQCVILQGSFVSPASSVFNAQINPASLALGQQGVGAAQVSNTVAPAGIKVNVFCNPNSSAAAPATNTSRLPPGLVSGAAAVLGSEYLLDLTGFPADIVCVQVDLSRQARNGSMIMAQTSIIDTVNKLVYVQTINPTTGGATGVPAGTIISFQVSFKDSIGI